MTAPVVDLVAAIDHLTNPIREQRPATGRWRTVASLWDQLCDSLVTRAGFGSRGVSSQPPLNSAVVSLVEEVERATAAAMADMACAPMWVTRRYRRPHCSCAPLRACPGWEWAERRTRDVSGELRAIHAGLRAYPDLSAQWAAVVEDWVARAAAIVSPARVTYLRGHRCLDCDSREVTVTVDGEAARRPALSLAWSEDQQISAVICACCGSRRWPYDLLAIAEQSMNWAATAETLSLS